MITDNDLTLPKNIGGFIWYFVKKQKWWLFAIQILCFAWTLDFTVWPQILKNMIDSLISISADKSQMWILLKDPIIFMLCFWLVIEFSFRIQGFLIARTFPKIESMVRMSMFSYIEQHSYRYFSNHFAGDISNKISDISGSITNILRMIITLFIPVLAGFIIATSIFASMHYQFALILATWIIIHISICLLNAKKSNELSMQHSDLRSNLSGAIVDNLSNIINVKLFASRVFEYSYINKKQDIELAAHRKSLFYIEKIKILLGLSTFMFPGVIITGYMLYSYKNNLITIGDVVLIFTTTWNITMMAWFAGLEFPILFKEIGVCNQALKLIKVEHEIKDSTDAHELQVKKGEIEFANVKFAYSKDRALFNDKTVIIKAGEKVGLVGLSGSGKTSFVNLIIRFFDVDEGAIKIDGTDIREVTLDSLRRNIAMIPQDPSLFHRSIAENILYGREDATKEEMIDAAIKANCHNFVDNLVDTSDPGNVKYAYDVTVGERGIKLSGGERQRIAIARAILKNAPILIMDEATSALDSETESKIQESLEHLMKNKTTIVIAHRLSTLVKMDRILVFANGGIVEDGSHKKLIDSGGHYSLLWKMQSGGFLPEKLVSGLDPGSI